MSEHQLPATPDPAGRDFSRFWRISEGDCELLSARYSSQSFGRHSHERYAVGVISGGVEKLYYRGGYYLGGQSSVVTISPGEIHDGLAGCDAGWMYRMLYIDPTWLNESVLGQRFAADHIHLFHQAITHDPNFAQVFLSAHRLIEQSGQTLERETTLLELVSQLFQRNGVGVVPSPAIERDAVTRIKQKLDDEFECNIPLEELARLVDMDPLYLIRVFRATVGVSPHQYQIQRRIARVQHLLRLGTGIAEASFACGFFDQSHMARAFKKVVGVTPGSFRKAR
ncbi:helix-turn-helix transcriptional regulator [Pseudomonas gingeri]|uniref:helix-turn-helix transcriptional regulator n=1 Tax=Pseudomonas gingeri TaxID=117681 RepID=UPI0015A1704A|nr:AraC family transcriptional regulator [Pseudomonas gingeri]NWA01390.1 AraC family transcriptional regulator [Pseudomonas gingeri]NWA13807.1 AraC family transcriptional regulator [Pseudomonas gingeri]NWA52833.1 AraC family transcriptional regulator [Pseudomonas gingeri]NWA96330.1 AraC family transcriptional regulator [Pseudomonas gingeri]NWB00034.1 AraC family transcriptional regulator [Pseudomonas gingeri]